MAGAETARTRGRKSYAKRISDHVAVALVVYTLVLIFVTSPAMETEGMSILPYFLLVIFVAMVIPACRGMEHKWQALDAADHEESDLRGRFVADRIKIWVAAIGIPLILAGLFHAMNAVT